MRQPKVLMSVALIVAPLGACSDSTNTTLDNVAVSFATQSPTSPAPLVAGAARAPGAVTVGAATELTSVEVVLREIELKRADVVDCNVQPEPEGCEEIAIGPVLVDLPLTAGAAQRFAIDLIPGTYSRIDFEVHKVSGDPEDDLFRQQHPDFADISIRAMGIYNGQAFTFETDLDVEQELNLVPNLVVTGEGASANVTIFVDVSTWFRDASGQEVDPAEGNKGGQFESIVKENIKQSFKAFEDDDGDGEED